MEKETKKHSKNKIDYRIVILISVLLALIVLGTLSAFAASYDKIYSGIKIGGIDLSGMTVDEAYNVLSGSFGEELPALNVSAAGKSISIDFSGVAEYDFMKSAENAYDKGRKNIFTQFATYITPMITRNVPLATTVNEEKLEESLKDLQANIKDGYLDSTYTPEEDVLIIKTGHGGNAINIESLKENIIKSLEQHENVDIEAEITEKEFVPPVAKKIYEEIHSEPQDAYFDKENNTIAEHKNGYDFDVKKAESMLSDAKPDSEYKIALTVVAPSKTTEQLEQELFSDLLGTYTSKYNAGNENRSHNVALAASKFNGYIMMPGSVFSYNDVVGDRTIAAGYKNAAVYTANGVEDGIGGGICQVSSTLYNAVLNANLEIVYRRNHSYPVSYVPKGQDATVSMGSIDFKFANNADNPIQIRTYVGGGNCTVSIYGKKTVPFTVSIESTTVSTNPYQTEYEEDPEMEKGKEVITRKGITGYTVTTVRKVTINGETKTENMPKSVYVPLSEKIKIGTKEVEEKVEQPTENTQSPAENTSSSVDENEATTAA